MTLADSLLAELLAKPVGSSRPRKKSVEAGFTNKIEATGDSLSVTLNARLGEATEGRALRYIEDEGQDPSLWEVASWYKTEYGPVLESTGRPSMESVRFTFKRRSTSAQDSAAAVSDALSFLEGHEPRVESYPQGDYGFLVLLGDMQFGKIDGDGAAGTLQRVIECLDGAAVALEQHRRTYEIGHVHIGWLGDHIEGFVSQGGANAWRTTLPLSEQIRLTRRVMLYALQLFAPLAGRVTMAAVPGNHGEPVRFQGSGLTRYDDSHDTEALIAVADAAAMMPEAFGHVEFFVPETDELTVTLDVAGTLVGHAHGHKHRPGKHFEWWQGQSFNRDSPFGDVDLLVEGHLHHEFVEADGDRTFIQVPSMESESTWFRHSRGTGGNPGLIVAVTKDGRTPIKHVIAPTKKEEAR